MDFFFDDLDRLTAERGKATDEQAIGYLDSAIESDTEYNRALDLGRSLLEKASNYKIEHYRLVEHLKKENPKLFEAYAQEKTPPTLGGTLTGLHDKLHGVARALNDQNHPFESELREMLGRVNEAYEMMNSTSPEVEVALDAMKQAYTDYFGYLCDDKGKSFQHWLETSRVPAIPAKNDFLENKGVSRKDPPVIARSRNKREKADREFWQTVEDAIKLDSKFKNRNSSMSWVNFRAFILRGHRRDLKSVPFAGAILAEAMELGRLLALEEYADYIDEIEARFNWGRRSTGKYEPKVWGKRLCELRIAIKAENPTRPDKTVATDAFETLVKEWEKVYGDCGNYDTWKDEMSRARREYEKIAKPT